MRVDIYGLKTCDTCRKARRILSEAEVDHVFHDVRESAISKSQVTRWAKAAGWEVLLNRSSAAWRGLDARDKERLTETKAVALMAANPTLIKRPVIERGGTDVFVGWSTDVAAKLARKR